MSPNNGSRYFEYHYKREKLLRNHGFNSEPADDELLCYLFGIDDKLDILANLLGYSFTKDLRGRYSLLKMNPSQDEMRVDDVQES